MLGSLGGRKAALVLLSLAAMAPGSARATNGFNFYGFGAESVGVGGADVALVRDTAALVINPAGLGHIDAPRVESQLDPYYLVDVRHQDSLGNDERSRPRLGGSGSMAYAQGIEGTDLHVGIGAYVAGGLGFEYHDLDSGYGTRDEASTRFSVLRVAPGFAYVMESGLTLGASVSINYAMARQKELPDTSALNLGNLQQSQFGSRIDNLRGYGLGLNVGLYGALDSKDRWIFGMAYRSRSKLDLKDGKLTVNYNALGAGRIAYHDVALKGVTIPQDLQVGLKIRLMPRWKLMTEVTWIDWSDAIRNFRLEASSPERNPAPLLIPDRIERRQVLEWRDQVVYAVGLMYEPSPEWRASVGVNYGRQPVPGRNLTPLVAAIPEKHFALGFGRRMHDHWDVQMALVYVGKTTVDYENPASRITTDARESHETFALSLGISWLW